MRPAPDARIDADGFDQWYWPVRELKAFCEMFDLPAQGLKAELRARVLAHLRGEALPRAVRPKRSGFNWARETLTPQTVITPDVSFGPNVRGYFKARIGKRFSCHGDFMDWMRGAAGLTLADAEAAWHMLEARKDDPAFRRDIAECNNMLQYLRDARDAHPDLPMDRAQAAWAWKAVQPAPGGYVVFASSDLKDAG